MLQRVASSLLVLLLIAPNSVVAQPSSLPLSAQPASVTKVLPANTAGVLLVKTTPESWATLTQFQLFAEAEPFLASLPALFSGFSFAEDLQPWLGDRVAFALMPAMGGENDREASHGLLLAPVTDASQLSAFIDKIKASRPTMPVERQYQGVTILEWPAPEPVQGSEEAAPENPESPEAAPTAPDSSTPTPVESRQFPANLFTLRSPARAKAIGPTAPQLPLPLPENFPVPPIPSQPMGLAIAVLPGYLVTAATAQPIEQLLASQGQPQPRLNQSPLFQRTMQQPQFERSLVVGYANLEELARFPKPKAPEIAPNTEETPEAESTNLDRSADDIESPSEEAATVLDLETASEANTPDNTDATEIPTNTAPEAPEADVDSPDSIDSTAESTAATDAVFDSVQSLAQEYSAVDGYLWLQPEGIRSQLNSYYKTPQPAKADVLTPNADQILARLPGASYLTSSSRNLKQQWQDVVGALNAEPTLTSVIDLIRSGVQGTTGLNLEKDWLAWMDGEYAAFLFPTNQGPLTQLYPNLNLGLGFVVQTSDRAAAEATLQKFDQFVARQSQGIIAIANQAIEGQPVTSWEVEESGKRQSFFAHGWVNSDTLVVTSGLGPMKTLNPKPYLPLSENYTFKTATDSFPRPNQGYFYTNLGSSLAFIYGLFQPYSSDPELRDVKRWLGTIYSISASNSATPEKQQFDSLLVLAPAR